MAAVGTTGRAAWPQRETTDAGRGRGAEDGATTGAEGDDASCAVVMLEGTKANGRAAGAAGFGAAGRTGAGRLAESPASVSADTGTESMPSARNASQCAMAASSSCT